VFQEVFVEVKQVSPVSLYQDAESNLRRRQFAAGVGLLRQAGESGDVRAMMELGSIYWEGRFGQNKNESEALGWFRMAAYAGSREGMLNLAGFYDLGMGAREDPVSAAHWYREAFERGSQDAAYDLAKMYEAGRGVPRDLAKAIELYRAAASNGSPDARKRLAELGKQ